MCRGSSAQSQVGSRGNKATLGCETAVGEEKMREVVALLAAVGAGAVVFASPARADDGQFLTDIKSRGVAHPGMSDSDLLVDGRQVCIEVGTVGMSPDITRTWITAELQRAGAPPSYADATTLVHYALRDLCPEAVNSTGI
jgi:hypothetical protein